MDPTTRDRLRDDMKGVLEGELLLDELTRALYATDASVFEVPPLAIARPRGETDLQALVRYAAEHQIPVTARGSGTGLAGAALGPGLIVDFCRYWNQVLEMGRDFVRVQAGATWDDVTGRLARQGQRLRVEPAGASTATLGGIVAANASGPRVAHFGYPRDQVVHLEAMLDQGESVRLERMPTLAIPGSARFRVIHESTAALLERHAGIISSDQPRTPFNRCGYTLDRVLVDGTIDYPRLLAGSEGTLALFTELTLRTEPIPRGRGLALLACADLQSALHAVPGILDARPSACELIDGRLLSLVCARGPDLAKFIPHAAGAALMIEFEADSIAQAREQVFALIDRVMRQPHVLLALPVTHPEEIDRAWQLFQLALPTLATVRGGPPAVTGVEDIGVPPRELPDFITEVQTVLQRHQTTAAFVIHAAAGQVHLRPFLDPTTPQDASRLWSIAEDLYGLTLARGGTISTRHGTGPARTPWVGRQYPRLAPVFRELKSIFDPRHVLNPGNIVGPDPSRPAWSLRRGIPRPSAPDPAKAEVLTGTSPKAKPLERIPLEQTVLNWSVEEFHDQILSCHGCGECRSLSRVYRMCPVFRATRGEEASPRAKANLLRNLLGTPGDPRQRTSSEARAIADLCVNCKMCALDCPSQVDIPRMMLEAKAASVIEHGLDREDWVLARIATFSALGSQFSLITNRLLHGPISRWILEKFFGISRKRQLPPFASRSFLRQARRQGWTKKRPLAAAEHASPGSIERVALFIDIFANYHDPQIAEAAYRVLAHQGLHVLVPPGQRSCGMEALAQGDVDTARDLAQGNLRILADLVREGYWIVCPEPTAAVALVQDYPHLLDDPDARLVARHTLELTALLSRLHQDGRLQRDFQNLPISLGHHVPCHVKALGQPPAAPELLALIPGLRVQMLDVGCSGMAGTHGLRARAHDDSLRAGEPMLAELRRPKFLFGSTECSSCRLQMQEGSGKLTLHPVQYLALAYGLMPQIARRLQVSAQDGMLQ